jgi:two-component system response regulator FixJ
VTQVVHVVDDHAAIRRSLALLLGAAGHAVVLHESGDALLAAVEDPSLAPGCIILDVRMPGRDGLAVMELLARQNSPLPVIVVTGHADVALAVRAMRAGAHDFIEKPYSEQRILGAVEEALAAGRVAVDEQARMAAAGARIASLTPREGEVLEALVEGQSNKGTAARLGISPRTVEVHRANLMEKLSVRSLPEAVRIYLAAGVPRSG